MPPRDYKLRIADILDAIAAIQQFTAGMDYDAFAADRKTVDAVIHNLTIMGEAARSLPPESRAAAPKIPWKDMCDMRNCDMRNVVVHVYFGVNERIL